MPRENYVTKDKLQKRVDTLNRLTGNALEPYSPEELGGVIRYVPNPGCYTVDRQKGNGVRLSQMTQGGGETSLAQWTTNYQLYEIVSAMIYGIELERKKHVA